MNENIPRVCGFACPQCRGVRLFVYRTRRPCPGLVVRYRKCTACGHRIVTDERPRAPKGRPAKDTSSSVPGL